VSVQLLALLTILAVGLGFAAGSVARRRLEEKRARERTLAGRAKKAAQQVAGEATKKSLGWLFKRRFGGSDEES
jgi:hypothetical protein